MTAARRRANWRTSSGSPSPRAGGRRSEVLPLEWRNVDWAGRCVRLDPHTTKNGEARSFPFTTDIEKILKEQLAIHETLKKAGQGRAVRLPSRRRAHQVLPHGVEERLQGGRLPERDLIHDMRRSAVRTFERAGVPRSVAMSIVGHKTESIYRRYAIVDEAMQREAAARLDAWSRNPTVGKPAAVVKAFRKKAR